MARKDKTLWTDPEKKFKPINMQAVRIMSPAKGLHLPPIEKPETRAEREARQKREADRKENEVRAALKKTREEEAKRKQEIRKRKAEKKRQPLTPEWFEKKRKMREARVARRIKKRLK
jgi:hypothetical protein